MDIYCPTCNEPWDMDSLHEEVEGRWPEKPWLVDGRHDQAKYETYYDQVRKDFYAKGCKAMTTFVGSEASAFGNPPASWCQPPTDEKAKTRAAIAGELYALLGDDLDGAAAMLEDLDYLGY